MGKANKLEVYKDILNSIQFLYVIYDIPTFFPYKTLYKSISANRHTNANETFRAEAKLLEAAKKRSVSR